MTASPSRWTTRSVEIGLCLWFLFAALSASVMAAQPQPPEQQREYVPINQLPPQQQLPAARLLVAAYVFVIAALSGYMLLLKTRLGALHQEFERLDAEVKRLARR